MKRLLAIAIIFLANPHAQAGDLAFPWHNSNPVPGRPPTGSSPRQTTYHAHRSPAAQQTTLPLRLVRPQSHPAMETQLRQLQKLHAVVANVSCLFFVIQFFC